jgi:hypothetical protein
MYAMRCNTDKVAKGFLGSSARKRGIVNRIEDGLVPVEPKKEQANVDSHTKED